MVETVRSDQPAADDAALAREALLCVQKVLANHRDDDEPLRMTVDDGAEPVTVPRAAIDLLVRVLATMAAGQGVTLMPAHAELTSQQAADVLNVSRPFLIKLLEQGQIEFRTVGTHRRIQAESLMRYKTRNDAQRRDAASELAAMTQEMGLT